jgi:hypothetical protein
MLNEIKVGAHDDLLRPVPYNCIFKALLPRERKTWNEVMHRNRIVFGEMIIH